MTVKCWNVICLLLSEQSCSLVSVKQLLRFAHYCHGMILSASCLFDDHACEMLKCNMLVIVRSELFVVASETIVICLLLSWPDSFSKLSV